MKRNLILLVLIILSIINVKAQISRGTVVTGLNFSASFKQHNEDDQTDKYRDIFLESFIGYFFINNFSFDIGLVFSSTINKYAVDYIPGYKYVTENEKGIGFAPEIRYYLLKKSFHPYFLFECARVLSKYSAEYDNDSYANPINTYSSESKDQYISPGIGVLYRINNYIGFDLTIKYSWIDSKYTSGYSLGVYNSDIWHDTEFKILIGCKVFLFSK